MNMHSIVLSPTDHLGVQLLRYTVVGGAAFLVDMSLLIVLTEHYGVHYLLSAMAGFSAGLVFNYMLSVYWVFSRRRVNDRRLEFVMFVSTGIIGLLLNEAGLYLFTDMFLLDYRISKIVTTLIVYMWNFVSRKVFLFS